MNQIEKPLTLAVVGGLGIMASPMAKHWQPGGPAKVLRVHDRGHPGAWRDARRKNWQHHGATLVPDLAGLGIDTGEIDGIMVCAGKNGDDLPLIRELVGRAAQSPQRPFLLHLSTVSTGFVQAATVFAQKKGIVYANYPLTGGSIGAEQGTMLILGGGDERLFHRLQPSLKALGNPKYFGPSPTAGADVKFMGHMMVFNGLMGICSAAATHAECFQSGKMGGTAQGEFFDFLNGGAGGTRQWDVALSWGVKHDNWESAFSILFGAVDAIYTASLLIEKGVSALTTRAILNVAFAFSYVMNVRGTQFATQSIVREFLTARARELDAFVDKNGGAQADPGKQLAACVASFPAEVQKVVRLDVTTTDFEKV